jgi:hypothetical protein
MHYKIFCGITYSFLLLCCSLFFLYYVGQYFIFSGGEAQPIFIVPMISVVILGGYFGSKFSTFYYLPTCKSNMVNSLVVLVFVVLCSSTVSAIIYPLYQCIVDVFTKTEYIRFDQVFPMAIMSAAFFIFITSPISIVLGSILSWQLQKKVQSKIPLKPKE